MLTRSSRAVSTATTRETPPFTSAGSSSTAIATRPEADVLAQYRSAGN